MTSDPDFKVTTFSKSNIGKTARLKDKVTIAQEEKYITYGMVLCLVTLAGLSASAELLVCVVITVYFAFIVCMYLYNTHVHIRVCICACVVYCVCCLLQIR